MKEDVLELQQQAIADLQQAETLEDIERIRVAFLGKKGTLTAHLKALKDFDVEEKRLIGPVLHEAKIAVQQAITARTEEVEEAFDAENEWIDVTAPGVRRGEGSLSPLSLIQREIEEIFTAMGFAVADGPEVETEYYNFDAVNMPDHHPARDMQDTFWVSTEEGMRHVLRTHTSSVQVHYMEEHTPPLRVIVPGRVFRQEATDASHEHTFHQFEALVVGADVSVANFLFIAEQFFSQFFGQKINVRVRPSYFPFVEPGFEFDISCTNCDGKGCSACQQTGWLEVGGAGMVHQNVFAAAGYDRDAYTGFAWGFGLERLAMMKYKIDDIRHFHSGDLRLGAQFAKAAHL